MTQDTEFVEDQVHAATFPQVDIQPEVSVPLDEVTPSATQHEENVCASTLGMSSESPRVPTRRSQRTIKPRVKMDL